MTSPDNEPLIYEDAVAQWDAIVAPPPPRLQPVTIDVTKTALFVLDFNRHLCLPEKRPRCAAIIPNVKKLLLTARAKNMPVVMTYSHNMTPADFVEELMPIAGETVFGGEEDKFFGRDLDKDLKAKGIDTVLITGTSSNSCVMVSCHGAALRGFKVVLPVDATAAATAYQEQYAIWQIANAPLFRSTGLAVLTRTAMLTFKK